MKPLGSCFQCLLVVVFLALEILALGIAVYQWRGLSWKKKYLGIKSMVFLILTLIVFIWSKFHINIWSQRLENALFLSAGLSHLSFSFLTLVSTKISAQTRSMVKLPILGFLIGLFLPLGQGRFIFLILPYLILLVFLYSQRDRHFLAFRSCLFSILFFFIGFLIFTELLTGTVDFIKDILSLICFLLAFIYYNQNLNYFFAKLFISKLMEENE